MQLISTQLRLWMLCSLLFISSSLQASNFSQVFIFGDSLSDTGNLASLPGTDFLNNFPFNNGRFTNGLVSVEHVANRLNLSAEPSLHLVGPVQGTNFAVAGASASRNNPIDLNAQIAAFINSVNNVAPSDALYIVFIGGNDVRFARDAERKDRDNILRDAANNIENSILNLLNAGASKFFVVNVANVGNIPETRRQALANNSPRLIKTTERLTNQLNRKINRRVNRIRNSYSETNANLALVLFDLFTFSNFINDNSNSLGFINSEDPCFDFTLNPPFTLECNLGQNINQFIFFDAVHPSAPVQRRAGDAFLSALPAASFNQ